jgi:hypothetical protein
VGEIISESWARSNRYTRARSSESAVTGSNPFDKAEPVTHNGDAEVNADDVPF